MSNSEHADWVKAQKNTFENWVNECLKKRDIRIEDITSAFQNGVNLYYVYNELTGKKIKTIDFKPNSKIKSLQNLTSVLKAFEKDDVKLINIDGNDLHDKNLKIILGLTWALILKYHIIGGTKDENSKSSSSNSAAKDLLLEFVRTVLPDEKVTNFGTNWKNGDLFAKLVDGVEPGVYPESERPEGDLEKIEKGLDIAENKMLVPKVIEAEVIHKSVDELSMMTYISYLKKHYEENKKKVVPEKCVAHGKGLEQNLNSESPFEFIVELRNVFDKRCEIQLEDNPLKDVNPYFKGPQPVQFNSVYREPGIYAVEYDAVHPGKYEVAVAIGAGGPTIKNSPFFFTITEAPVKVSGNGTEDGAFKGEKLQIHVHTGTKAGGLLEEKEVTALVKSPSGSELPLESQDFENGEYAFYYTPDSAGEYEVAVNVWGNPVLAKKVKLQGDAAPAVKTKVSGEIAEKNELPNNRATGLVVKVEDEKGAPQEKRNVEVKVSDENGPIGQVAVKEVKPGEYEANIDVEKESGEVDVTVLVDGVETDKFKPSIADGTQVDMVEGTFTFEVHARNKNGELKTSGGDKWEVEIKGPNEALIDVETKDHQDGRYSAKYHLAAQEGGPSSFKVSAKLDGQHVPSSPFKHELAPKPSVGQRLKNFFSIGKK